MKSIQIFASNRLLDGDRILEKFNKYDYEYRTL